MQATEENLNSEGGEELSTEKNNPISQTYLEQFTFLRKRVKKKSMDFQNLYTLNAMECNFQMWHGKKNDFRK